LGVQVIYQAEMLAQILRLAQAKAQALVQAVPQGQPQREAQAVLLLQEVEKVLRQAVALQQLAALPQEQEVPLLELGLPQGALQQLEEQVRQGWEQQVQRALAVEQVRAEAGEWAVGQVLTQVAQERELVQVPLLEAE
jgi:hypothetical protein